MPTPTKPYLVLSKEKKSHRTKKELTQRKDGEKALSSNIKLNERVEVLGNEIAHKEFIRINGLLENIEKSDALYEAIINRYCMIQAECYELDIRRNDYQDLLKVMRDGFKEVVEEMKVEDKVAIMLELASELSKITTSINNIDKIVQTKRKMLLDIEKENIMTIASALRSIPKKEKDEVDELRKALSG